MFELTELSDVSAALRCANVSAILADVPARFLNSEVDDEATDDCSGVLFAKKCVNCCDFFKLNGAKILKARRSQKLLQYEY